MKKNISMAVVLLSTFFTEVLLTGGCASPGKDTAIGAGAGGATGAAIGGATGGWKGAAIGAAAGGAVGAGFGNLLDKQKQEMDQVANARRTENGILVQLKNDLLFDTDSAVLKPEAVEQLSKLGDIITKYPQDQIQIEGFTDNVGNISYNETLSQKRADAVKNVLLARGVQPKQLTTMGYGQERPIASNKTPTGRAQNRRVELYINMPQSNA